MPKSHRQGFLQGIAIFFVGIVLLAYVQHDPIHSTLTNVLTLTGSAMILMGVFLVVWRIRIIRCMLIAFIVGVAGLLLLPSRKIDVSGLRARYLENLKSFEGTSYVWGGEARNGVDCSGLPRRAWREALFSEGLATMNGHLLRAFLDSWWNDASARELAQGDGGRTVSVSGESTLMKMSVDKLLPGDLTITTSGVHMLVYFGDGKWIEADPVIHRVIIFDPKTDKNDWSYTPVVFYRWAELN